MVITIARAACTERDRKHAAAVTAHNHRSDSGMWLFRQPHTSNANQTRLGVGRGGTSCTNYNPAKQSARVHLCLALVQIDECGHNYRTSTEGTKTAALPPT